jgi:hypothetical protein
VSRSLVCAIKSFYLYLALIRWNDSQAAILKGAALRGLEGLRPTVTIATRHYGWSWHTAFREGVDDEKDSYIDEYDGNKMCRGRMCWPVNMVGQLLFLRNEVPH